MFIVYKLGYMGKKDYGVIEESKWEFQQSRADEMGFNIEALFRESTEYLANERKEKLQNS